MCPTRTHPLTPPTPAPFHTPVRCAFFACVPQWDGVYFFVRASRASDSGGATALYVLEEAPTLLLLALYTQQVLVWAHSYHTASGSEALYSRRVVPIAAAANLTVWLATVGIWVAIAATRGTAGIDPDAWSLASAGVAAGAFLGAGVALSVYGALLARTVRAAPLGLALRTSQLRVVRAVSGCCTAAFLLRAGALLAAAWADVADYRGFDDSFSGVGAAVTVAFFAVTELLPLSVLLWYHRPRARSAAARARARGTGGAGGASSPRSPFAGSGGGGSSGDGGYDGAVSPSFIAGAVRALRFSFSPPSAARQRSPKQPSGGEEGSGSNGSSPPRGQWRLIGAVLGALALRTNRAPQRGPTALLRPGSSGGDGTERTRLLQAPQEGYGAVVEFDAEGLESARAGAAAAAAVGGAGGARGSNGSSAAGAAPR